MNQITKKQHYVPQFYLRNWRLSNEKHQVYVYDKEKDCIRINNIEYVASERYFYDIDFDDFFTETAVEKLHAKGFSWSDEVKRQGIERTFAEKIEKPFAEELSALLEKVKVLTPWHISNCEFLSQEKKKRFSEYLTFQIIRTKSVRMDIMNTSDCFSQILKEMEIPDSLIEKYNISKEAAKQSHIMMFFDSENIKDVTMLFYNLTWVLGINRTNVKFFTSDNPIITHSHIVHPFIQMNGLASKGVEVVFPLSPNVILIMFDGEYHQMMKSFDRCYVEIDDEQNVYFYNSLLAMQAGRFVFSSDGNFEIINTMKHVDPNVFNYPQTQIKWGGKTNFPQRKEAKS